MEAGGEAAEREALRGLEWLKPLQVLDVKGDWAEQRPDVRPGGWAFQYNNAHYPDPTTRPSWSWPWTGRAPGWAPAAAMTRPSPAAREWVVGLQSQNGGWGAFDADNTFYYLNNIPFADHGALLDPPTVDVAARCVGMLAQLGEPKDSPRMQRALAYLEPNRSRMAAGSAAGASTTSMGPGRRCAR